jgi:hypothetical protein
MTSTGSNGIGKKVQMAVAGVVIAGSLLVSVPMTAGAQTCAEDFTGPGGVPDGEVNISDVSFVLMHYRQEKPRGSGIFLVGDVSAVLAAYHHPC